MTIKYNKDQSQSIRGSLEFLNKRYIIILTELHNIITIMLFYFSIKKFTNASPLVTAIDEREKEGAGCPVD